MVVNIGFSAVAEQQPELPLLMTNRVRQQPMQHGAKRRHAGSGGDEDGIAQRRPQDEIAERPLAADRFAYFHVTEEIRHEAVLHPVEAECKAIVLSRRGGDGVGPGDLFAVGLVRLERQPLPGDETETRHTGYLEFQMLSLG